MMRGNGFTLPLELLALGGVLLLASPISHSDPGHMHGDCKLLETSKNVKEYKVEFYNPKTEPTLATLKGTFDAGGGTHNIYKKLKETEVVDPKSKGELRLDSGYSSVRGGHTWKEPWFRCE